MEHMDSKEIAEINELALQLEEEQAIVIANKLGEVVSRLFGNDKQ